ncbi:MAG: substrate-binding domain-containing protein, partial [Oscillospiraceae bacterium]|nr:substrate-binding domain-containing protein [Oscillospiraceae bacterium]
MPMHSESYNPAILGGVLDRFPLVLADRYLPGLSVPFVGSDNAGAAAEAVAHLFALGHRHVGFISSATTTTSLRERLDGYINAYAQSNYPLHKDYILDTLHSTMPEFMTGEETRRDVARLAAFFGQQPVTAVLVADARIGQLVRVALQTLSRSVPGDISVISFDTAAEFNFSHMAQQDREMGVLAAQLLLERIRAGESGPAYRREMRLPCQFVAGESTIKIPHSRK